MGRPAATRPWRSRHAQRVPPSIECRDAPRDRLLLCLLPGDAAAPAITRRRAELRDRRRPHPARHCQKCHGTEKPKSDLDLTTAAGLIARRPEWTGGRARQAGAKPARRSDPRSFDAPRGRKATRGGRTRSAVALGQRRAPHGGGGAPQSAESAGAAGGKIDVAARDFWAFRPLSAPVVPQPQPPTAARTPIDAFIVAQLETHGLTLSTEADRFALSRRQLRAPRNSADA